MKLDPRKKNRHDRIIRSKSSETEEMREIGRKEAGELRGFPILCMGIMEDVFHMEGKECKEQERLKMCKRKSMPDLAWDKQLCVGQWQRTRRGLWKPLEIQWGKGGAQREERLVNPCGSAKLEQVASRSITQGLWLGNRKSQIVGED